MARGVASRIATISPGFVDRAVPRQLEEYLAVTDPDLIVPTADSAGRVRRAVERCGSGSLPVCEPRSPGGPQSPRGMADSRFVLAPDTDSLQTAVDTAREPQSGEDTAVIITPVLELSVDTTSLSTTIHGREALSIAETSTRARPGDGQCPAVLSTGLPVGYRNRLDGCLLVGIGDASDPSDTELQVVEVREGSTILTRSIDQERLGLLAVTEVGPNRAETLREAGYESRSALAEADRAALQDLPGLGPDVVGTIQASATAISSGTVVRRSRTSLPVTDPLFIDIETDGLHPTVTWLIGLLDGGAETGTYTSFLNRDPEDPGAAIEAFVDWYSVEGEGRPLVAYNGRTFDFPVLRDHLREYRPGLLPEFESATRFDPYAWTIRDGNALLPGRTDQLEDVAAALGFEPSMEGLTGAAVARRYRRYLEAPGEETSPNWERLDGYCEDDVRALAHVFDALRSDGERGLRDSDAGVPAGVSSGTGADETTQGTLADW